MYTAAAEPLGCGNDECGNAAGGTTIGAEEEDEDDDVDEDERDEDEDNNDEDDDDDGFASSRI